VKDSSEFGEDKKSRMISWWGREPLMAKYRSGRRQRKVEWVTEKHNTLLMSLPSQIADCRTQNAERRTQNAERRTQNAECRRIF